MKKGMRSNADGVLEKKRRSQKWKRLAGVLGCLVVIVTAYVLMRPAETLERELICGMEEHQHSVEQGCYQKVVTELGQPICGMEEAGHVHSEECYSEESVLTCTEPEGGGHQHGESCYTMESTLICDLSEADGHTHTAECYPAEDAEATPELELVCELPEHTHTEDCYADDAAQHAQVEEVAALIDALPSAEEVEARLEELLAADDAEAYDAYCAELARQVEQANTAYEALTDEQQAQLNIDKLTALFVYLPAKEGTFTLTAPATESGIIVTISGETASLPFPVEELTLTAVEVEDENANALRDEALESEELTAAENYMLDIRLMHGEEKVQPTGPITVTFAGLPLDGGADVALADDVEDNADTDAEPAAYQAQKMAAQAAAAANTADDVTDDTADDTDGSYVTGPKVYQIDEGTQQATEVDVAVNDENNVVLETDQLTNLYSVSLLAANGNITTAAALKTACEAGGTVVLGKDITISTQIKIPAGKNTVLDLNGYKIVCSSSDANNSFFVDTSATLTIKDSKANFTKKTTSTVSNTCRAATYDSNNSVLTYYVTHSVENDAVNHTTAETTTKYTVALGNGNAGAIIGSSNSKVCIGVKGTLSITGGYICNWSYTYNNAGTITLNKTGSMTMSGGVIAANSFKRGGAIYSRGKSITMSGGVISGNKASDYGGGVYIYGTYRDTVAKFTMTGGYITNNSQIKNGGTDGGGGGVFLDTTAAFTMTAGYITCNEASKVGGGISTFHTGAASVSGDAQVKIIIDGGFISGNKSTKTFGGGINCDTFNQCTIGQAGKPVYISNNRGEGMEGLGGGGIHAGHGSRLTLYNALITKNTAGALGGGYSCCETSSTFLYLSDGVAIFDNSDGGKISPKSSLLRGDCDKDSYIYTNPNLGSSSPLSYPIESNTDHSDIFVCGHVNVTSKLLGGGDPKWCGSRDGIKIELKKGEVTTAHNGLGMKSYASNADKALARTAAKVYITGNYSGRHGGGVLSNGIVYFGAKPSSYAYPTELNLIGEKKLLQSDGKTEAPIQDGIFHFAVTTTSGKVVSTGSADSNGVIRFEPMTFSTPGTYTYIIKETTVSTKEVTVDPTTYTMTVNVDAKEEIKHDTDTGKYMRTGLYYYPTAVKVINNTTGEEVFNKPAKQSDDKPNIETTIVIRISTSIGAAAFTNKLNPYTLNIIKKDKDTGAALAGAQFRVHLKSGNKYVNVFGAPTGTAGVYTYATSTTAGAKVIYTTDDNGKLQIKGLPFGTYKVLEVKAPVGYVIADEWKNGKVFTVDLSSAKDCSYTVEVEDPAITYTLDVTKQDEATGKGIGVATFEMQTYVMDPRAADKGGTGKEMYIGMYCDKVKDGVYRYVGYFWKSGMPSTAVRKFDTDAKGKLQIIDLPIGKYQMREMTAPTGYQIADQWKKWNDIPLNATDVPTGTKTITVKDPSNPYTLNINKLDAETGNALAGAQFKLQMMKGDSYTDVSATSTGTGVYTYKAASGTATAFTTDKDGKLQIKGLPSATYRLIETKAPYGYQIAKEWKAGKEITLDISNAPKYSYTVEVKDPLMTYTLDITKQDENTGELLADAKFKVQWKNGSTYTDIYGISTDSGTYEYSASSSSGAVNTFSTGKDGKLQITGLPAGTYKVIETSAPNRYLISDKWKTGQEITLSKTTAPNYSYPLIVEDPSMPYTLNIRKVDAESYLPLAGAQFKLSISVPDTSGGTGAETWADVFLIQDTGKYRYMGYRGNPLQSDKYQDQYVTVMESDIEGNIQVLDLPSGLFKLTETKAPDGYEIFISTEWVEFILNAKEAPDGTLSLEVPNYPYDRFDVNINKCSAEDGETPVPGAKYQLLDSTTGAALKFSTPWGPENYYYDPSGSITTLVTNEDGNITILQLPRGNYILHETEAPQGFKLMDDYEFNPAEKADSHKWVFLWLKEPLARYELPETGGGGTKPYIITGAALLVGAACLMVCREARRKAGGRTF